MKVKVIREITSHKIYETIVDFDIDKDNPFELDDTDDMELVADAVGDDSTLFEDPETGELLDLIEMSGYKS